MSLTLCFMEIRAHVTYNRELYNRALTSDNTQNTLEMQNSIKLNTTVTLFLIKKTCSM